MSGFLSILHTDGAPVDPALLRGMTDAMAFRGPDHQATWHAGSIGLGHALLHTTFESAGERQPLSLDGEVWIVADARIDGRADLMRLLRSHDRVVSADAPDVELLLHAYHVWGEGCLDYLLGDWGFVLWDGRRRSLFCAHDHWGVVPLYYAWAGSTLLVGNTLECLRQYPGLSDALNEQAIADYLIFAYNQERTTTFFTAIERLAPAHKLVWSGANTRVTPYWRLPEPGEPLRYRRPAEYVEHFRELFDQAVRDRLRTDALGAHLSGGMDSSSVTLTARRLLASAGRPFDLRAYTIVYRELIPDDEGPYARLAAAAAGIPAEQLISEDFITQPPADPPLRRYPEPTVIGNQVAETDLSLRVARHARVLLAGFGGDPAFYGDPSYLSGLIARRQAGPLVTALWLSAAMNGGLPRVRLRSTLRARFWPKHPIERGMGMAWFNPDFVNRLDLRRRVNELLEKPPIAGRPGMALAPLWSQIFAWADPGSTGVPVKTRYPFFDLRLIQYLERVPPVPWLDGKLLLRAAMRGVLPEPLLRRPKTPLRGYPHLERLRRDGIQPWMEELLTLPDLEPYLDGRVLLSMLRRPAQLTPSNFSAAAPIFGLAYWLRYRQTEPALAV